MPFSNALDAVLRRIKKDEYDESVHSSSRPLLSDSTHRERYYESATYHLNTPKRPYWRGSLLLQTHKHCIQRSIGWLRSKKATAIQQKKHVVAKCVSASWSLCQAGLLLLSVARFVCDVSFWFETFGLLDPHKQAWRRLFLLYRTLNFTDPTCFQL